MLFALDLRELPLFSSLLHLLSILLWRLRAPLPTLLFNMVTGPIVRLIGSGIGLASEAVAAHKQGKAEKSQGQEKPQVPSPHSGNDSESPVYAEVDNQNEADELVARGQAAHTDFEEPPPNYDRVVHDEEDWELDAAAEEAVGRDTDTENDDGTKLDLRKITQHFIERHPLPSGGHHAQGKLPCPVIIPQQRPRTKARGFVNAYAPVLENCGVDQKTFIDFLKTFHKASQVCLPSSLFGSWNQAENI